MGFSPERITFMTMGRQRKNKSNYLANFEYLDSLSEELVRKLGFSLKLVYSNCFKIPLNPSLKKGVRTIDRALKFLKISSI